MVNETSGCRDDHIGSLLQHILLLPKTETTNQLTEGDVGVSSKFGSHIVTLHCQFTSRHQNRNTAGGNLSGTVEQTFKDGDNEGCCFSGTSDGTTDDIFAQQGHGDCLALNGCWVCKADGSSSTEDRTR